MNTYNSRRAEAIRNYLANKGLIEDYNLSLIKYGETPYRLNWIETLTAENKALVEEYNL